VVQRHSSSACADQFMLWLLSSLFPLPPPLNAGQNRLPAPKSPASRTLPSTPLPHRYGHFDRRSWRGKLADPENSKARATPSSPTQFVEVLPLPEGSGIDRLDHIAWEYH